MSWSAKKAIAWGKKQVGSTKWRGKCQGFVADCCYHGGQKPRMSMSTAADARKVWMISTSKTHIPHGAALYFKGSNVRIGHVAMYIGNGEYLNPAATGIKISKLSGALNYYGWGWNGYEPPTDITYDSAGSSSSGGGGGTSSTAYTGADDDTDAAAPAKVEISTVNNVGYSGTPGVHKGITNTIDTNSQGLEVLIHKNKTYIPNISDTLKIEQTENAPSVLTMKVLKDPNLDYEEGNDVAVRYNGEPLFYGYVFKKSRKETDVIDTTAYDQLRYLKSKDTYSYTNKTADEFLKIIANDYGLVVGSCDNTKSKLSRIEETTALDMLCNALDDTLLNTGVKYIVYDDFGKLRIRSILNMVSNYHVDKDTAESIDYTSSIDSDVYTAFRFAWDDSSTGIRYKATHHTEEPERRWGRLTYYENLDVGSNSYALNDAYVVAKAKALAQYYSRKNRTLTVRDALGSVMVRPGVSVSVDLELGDLHLTAYMYVKAVTHKFQNGRYTMDLELTGFNIKDIQTDVTAGAAKLASLIPEISVDTYSGSGSGGGSGGGSASGGSKGASAVETEVFNFLRNNMGLSAAAACGVMGNIEVESGFKVTAKEVGGGGYGLIQWTGPRKTRLKTWCSRQGLNYATLTGQLRYLKWEMTYYYKKYYDQIRALNNSSKSVETACSIWCWKVERPGIANYDRRSLSAKKYYGIFGGK